MVEVLYCVGCKGSGYFSTGHQCSICNGTGKRIAEAEETEEEEDEDEDDE